MPTTPFDHFDNIKNLLAFREDPFTRMVREMAIQQRQQNLLKLTSSMSQLDSAFTAYSGSQHWAELSAAVQELNAVIHRSGSLSTLQRINRSIESLVFETHRAVIPEPKVLGDFYANVASAIRPVQTLFDHKDAWHNSLVNRMSSIAVPWAMEQHLGVSVVGFARIARLSDLARSSDVFAGSSVEIFDDELGAPVPYSDDVEDREAAAIEAGLNPEVIAFPDRAYPSVLISAGFEFQLENFDTIRSDRGDSSGVFDPHHRTLFDQVQHRLRTVIETELRQLGGERWYRTRVSDDLRRRWEERRQKDQTDRGDSYDLIFYSDFMDLCQIVCQNNNWKEVFQRYFKSKEDFNVSCHRLSPVRNALSHGRPLVRSDQLTLFSEGTRILTALNSGTVT